MSKNALFGTYLFHISQIIPFIPYYLPFIIFIGMFDKDISFYTIFDFINQNNQYEQAKNTTRKGKRAICSRKHQTPLRIYYFMRGIYYYRNLSKPLV